MTQFRSSPRSPVRGTFTGAGAEALAGTQRPGRTVPYDPSRGVNAGARQLHELVGVDRTAHRKEPCHAIVVTADYDGKVADMFYCVEPKRHAAKGESELTVTRPLGRRPLSEREQEAADKAKETRAANRHRDAFVVKAIGAKVRSKDLSATVLPILLDVCGQTELTDAAQAPHGRRASATAR